ncbi:MAG: cation diffusion facilitator family transporter [Gemmatimonadota bacterium]
MVDPARRAALDQVKLVTWTGLAINLVLSALKFAVGIIGSSQAVVADAVHSVSDMTTDLAVIFGVRYWSAPPDDEHPYGHGRIETLVTTFIGAALAAVGAGIAYNAVVTVRDADLAQPDWVAVSGPLVSIVAKEWLYRWTVAVGVRAHSSAVVANAWHHRSDALSSVPAFLAVALSAWHPGWAFVDHIGALVVSIFILKVSRDVLSPSLSELIDRGATRRERERIAQVSRTVPGVRDVHRIRARRIGTRFLVDLHIHVDPEISVRAGHEISEAVQQQLIARGPEIVDVVVHLEPHE